jgi:GAF domain-containing protein
VQFWRSLARGAAAPPDTPQLRATIALNFFLVWILSASVALLVRTTSETHHRTIVLALVASLYVGAVAVLVAGRRLSRRAFNVPTAIVTVIITLGQYLAGTAPAGHLFPLFLAIATVFAAYFFSAFETALQILLMACAFEALLITDDLPGVSPWYGPLVLVPLALLALLVITIRGRSALAEAHLRSTRIELERGNAILEAVAFAAGRFLQTPETAIDEVIARLGAATNSSRVYLNRTFREGDKEVSSVLAEWVAPGIPPQIDNPALRRLVVPRAWVQPFLDDLESGRPTEIAHNRLPPEVAAAVPESRAKTTLAVPIFVADQRWASLGLQDWERERAWSDAETEALKAAAGILGAGLLRLQRTWTPSHAATRSSRPSPSPPSGSSRLLTRRSTRSSPGSARPPASAASTSSRTSPGPTAAC